MLDVTPLQGQIAAAVSADRPGLAESIGERLLQVAEQDFDLQAAAAEDDRLHTAPKKLFSDSLTLQGRGSADPELPIDDRRVIEQQALGPAGGAVVVDQRH